MSDIIEGRIIHKPKDVVEKVGDGTEIPTQISFRKFGDAKLSELASERVNTGGAGFLTPNGPK